MRKLTLSHYLQIVLVIGVSVLIWQTILLRQAITTPVSRERTPDAFAMPVRVVNEPLDVNVDSVANPVQVEVANEPDVHVSNPTLDVYVSNP